MKTTLKTIAKYVFSMAFIAGCFLSWRVDFAPGISAGSNFRVFIMEMAGFLPLIFILIGLIDVWLPRSVVDRHIGSGSGIWGSVWALS